MSSKNNVIHLTSLRGFERVLLLTSEDSTYISTYSITATKRRPVELEFKNAQQQRSQSVLHNFIAKSQSLFQDYIETKQRQPGSTNLEIYKHRFINMKLSGTGSKYSNIPSRKYSVSLLQYQIISGIHTVKLIRGCIILRSKLLSRRIVRQLIQFQ